MRYGTDLLQLIVNALPIGARAVNLDLHAYGGEKESGTDTSLDAFSDQQRPLGTEELEFGSRALTGERILTQIRNGFAMTGDLPESDEEVAVSTTFDVSFKAREDCHGDIPKRNYFLPVLDMLFHPATFKERILELKRFRADPGLGDPLLEFLRRYRFTAMDTGRSLHLVAASMVPNGTTGYERAQEKFLAQALMFPSLGVDAAWVGHSLFREWMGLRISANTHTQVPTISTEITDLLRSLDQQGQGGQAISTPSEGSVDALFG